MEQYAGMQADEVEHALQKESGLFGISGVSNDLRDIMEAAKAGNHRAELAIKIYVKEVTGYIGRYAALMGGLDAVAFTGGIGEKSEFIRQSVMQRLAFLPDVKVFVIPANEELGVARESYKALTKS